MDSEVILVVEDDRDLRTIFRTALEREGYRVLEAADGREALRCLLHPDGGRIRLVVSDVVMPGFGGRELLSRTADFFPELPVVLLSGRVPEDCAYTGTDLRATAFLPKPVEPLELARAVRAIVADRDRRARGFLADPPDHPILA